MAKADAFTLSRAETLARKIARFWRNKGYQIHVWVERVPGFEEELDLYQVRSDMVGGLPRSDSMKLAA